MVRVPKLHVLVIAVWALVLSAGFWLLIKYEVTPGRAAAAEANWPASVGSLVPLTGKPTVVMAAHPECPCSRASVAELGELMARYPGRMACYVLFEPGGAITAEDCRKSDLWKAAEQRGITPVVDEEKVAIRSFHAHTSGQVMLYSAAGALEFSGGITAARDHAGKNDGSDAIEAFLATGKAVPARTPVFGCSLE